MNTLLAIIGWYFVPGYQFSRERQVNLRPRSLPLTVTLTHAVARVAVLGVFVWALATSHWYAAILLGTIIIALGFLSWTITRRMAQRVGGQQG